MNPEFEAALGKFLDEWIPKIGREKLIEGLDVAITLLEVFREHKELTPPRR